MSLDKSAVLHTNNESEEYYQGNEIDDKTETGNGDLADHPVGELGISNVDQVDQVLNTDISSNVPNTEIGTCVDENGVGYQDNIENQAQPDNLDMNDEEQNVDEQNVDADVENTNSQPKKKAERRQRSVPKTIMANQQKYIETLERQKKMMQSKKNNATKPVDKYKTSTKSSVMENNQTTTDQPNVRRIVVAGKIKYVPIKKNNPETVDVQTSNHPTVKDQAVNNNQITDSQTTDNQTTDNQTTDIEKQLEMLDRVEHIANLTPGHAKKHRELKSKLISAQNKSKKGNGLTNKIPSKYAQHIENNVRKQTIKNVKNFSDLRRLKAIQDIESELDIDPTKASIQDLRKMKLEQRKQNQEAAKKRLESNKKESAIQEILRDDKRSKLSKALAIKKLSVNSRHKNKPAQLENSA